MNRTLGLLAAMSWTIAACSSSTDDAETPNGGGTSGTSGTSSGTSSTTDPSAIHHVLSTGQSNAIGFAAQSVLSTAQPYANLMFDTGVIPASSCDDDGCRSYDAPTSFVPLVEGDRYFTERVETMSSGLANEIGLLAKERAEEGRHDVLVSVHGRSGNVYECLRKGGCSFQDGKGYIAAFDDAVREMRDAHRLATDLGRPYVVTAITAIHGESDHYDTSFPIDGSDGTPGAIQNYGDALVEWQRDYEAAVHAETNQTGVVPLFVSQMANWNDREVSAIPTFQLAAHYAAPGKVILVGATYMLPFASDCIHYTSEGERLLGEYFAKAYSTVVLQKKTWEPLRPSKLTLEGRVITVRFVVPSPPLVIDTERVSDPGANGFEYLDDSGEPPVIEDVAVSGADTLTITLSAEPTAGGRRLRYALRATPQTCPGPRTGPRGNVRDSDATPSQSGSDLANWSVSFDASLD